MAKLKIYQLSNNINTAPGLVASIDLPDAEEVLFVDLDRDDMRVYVFTREAS